MSRYYNAKDIDSGEDLEHYGVKGMKWGVRRYVDNNGRLTAEGKKRYGSDPRKMPSEYYHYQLKRYYENGSNETASKKGISAISKRREDEITKHFSDSKNQYDWDHRFDNDKSFDNVNKFYDDLGNRYRKEYGSFRLKDMGYEDTEAGREFVGQSFMYNKIYGR